MSKSTIKTINEFVVKNQLNKTKRRQLKKTYNKATKEEQEILLNFLSNGK